MDTEPLLDRRHLDFVVHDLLEAAEMTRWPHFSAHDRSSFDAAIELAHRLAIDRFLPHNRAADLHEPRLVDGRVQLLPEIGEAVRAFHEAGFGAALADFGDGGMQLPFLITSACDALFSAANPGTVAYPALTRAAANLLLAHGSAEQRRRYVLPMLAGRYFGTMCLSEPQAGSSLADITTRASPHADGSYRLTGAKMWISAGDHELAENIIHLVLARIDGAPPGVRGISLFLVPRFRVDAEGGIGARNDVKLAGLNHKLGQRGSVNTFLKFGESGDCHAELIGTAGQGLAQMFHMMNEERIAVGMGAIQQASVAYRYARSYAGERRQGRHPDQRDPASPPVPLIEHADVRRMLLVQKCVVEYGQLLCLFAARLVDERTHAGSEAARHEAHELLELLTPIVKAYASDQASRACDLAIQVLGGYGYTRDYPVEQCWRDNRINPIHEGTNGIQALDLLGRKLAQAGGLGLRLLLARMRATGEAAARHPELVAMSGQLCSAVTRAEAACAAALARMAAGELRRQLAQAHAAMQMLGRLCFGWCGLWAAGRALDRLADGDPAVDFLRGKLHAARFWFATEMPGLELDATLLGEAEDSALATPPACL